MVRVLATSSSIELDSGRLLVSTWELLLIVCSSFPGGGRKGRCLVAVSSMMVCPGGHRTLDGMFHHRSSRHENEVGVILDRKGICKIALKVNVAIVPVYAFGHTDIYDIVVDPVGILQFRC